VSRTVFGGSLIIMACEPPIRVWGKSYAYYGCYSLQQAYPYGDKESVRVEDADLDPPLR